jgi:hypothetical protein
MVAVATDHSSEFVDAALAEADRLRLEAERLREHAARHMKLAESATAEAIALEQRARELDEILGRAPQLRLELQTDALRGQRLREAAIAIIARHNRLGDAIHYRDWFQLLLAEGHTIDGKDPLATFLTQLTRSPAVLRDPQRPGVYRVDLEPASKHALRELDRARHALSDLRQQLSDSRAHPDSAADVRLKNQLVAAERRAAAAERALAEIARTQATLGTLAA